MPLSLLRLSTPKPYANGTKNQQLLDETALLQITNRVVACFACHPVARPTLAAVPMRAGEDIALIRYE